MTKAPCKFHLLQGACSSPVVCRAPLFLPCSLQGYRLRCLCPGRNAAWPQRAAASCFAQPHVGCGHDALQIRDLTELRRLVGARHASPLRSRSILARAFSCSLRYEGNVRDNPRNRCERAITELRLTRSPRVWLQSSWRKAPAPRAAEAGCPCRGSKSFPQRTSAFLLQSWASYCSWPLPLGGTKYSCKLNFDNSLSRKKSEDADYHECQPMCQFLQWAKQYRRHPEDLK